MSNSRKSKNNDKENINELSSVSHVKSLKELLKLIYLSTENGTIDIEYIRTLMTNYEYDLNEFQSHINFKESTYTRNLIDKGNGTFNLILVCWEKKSGSPIHDHTNSNCFMKCLQGNLIETQYSRPPNSHDYTENEEPMNAIKKTVVNPGEVTYIHDKIGVHRVENPSETQVAISLHLYTPPYEFCRVYSEQTSHVDKIASMTFHSINGEKTSLL